MGIQDDSTIPFPLRDVYEDEEVPYQPDCERVVTLFLRGRGTWYRKFRSAGDMTLASSWRFIFIPVSQLQSQISYPV